MALEFGYSPCPNDTYMFWALVHGKINSAPEIGTRFADIQMLNQLATGPNFLPLTKVSAATFFHPLVQQRYCLLKAGAALGRGCGPLVVSLPQRSLDSNDAPLRLAHPGPLTTAAALSRMALGARVGEWVEMRYDRIMPAVAAGEVDAGVIIHESRFVYPRLGLGCLLDLGQWWEERYRLPLPLGVMVIRRDLQAELAGAIEAALQLSIHLADQAVTDRQSELWEYMRSHAIELEDDTIYSHVQLYVNDFSRDLGPVGQSALEAFGRACALTRATSGA